MGRYHVRGSERPRNAAANRFGPFSTLSFRLASTPAAHFRIPAGGENPMHSFYPQDSGARDGGDIFNGNAPSSSQPQQQLSFSQQQLGNLQQQVSMEMLENLLAMQDPAAQGGGHQGHGQSSATPQALLEHQLRLNQLQQLQQLQNQIFQQQVRPFPVSPDLAGGEGVGEVVLRSNSRDSDRGLLLSA